MIRQAQVLKDIADENAYRDYSLRVCCNGRMTGLEGLIYCELARVGVERSASEAATNFELKAKCLKAERL